MSIRMEVRVMGGACDGGGSVKTSRSGRFSDYPCPILRYDLLLLMTRLYFRPIIDSIHEEAITGHHCILLFDFFIFLIAHSSFFIGNCISYSVIATNSK